MRKIILGKTGLEVAAVGIGGIPIQRVPQDQAVEVLRRALDLGANFIDTAAGYGDSQRKIGLAIKGRRDGLVLASKTMRRTKQEMLEDIDRSRREMGCDVIDLYQLHNVSSPEAWQAACGFDGAMEGLLDARRKGHIRYIGFSSHNLDLALKLVDEPVFQTVQFPFNLVTYEASKQLIPKARAKGLGFIAMKPLCGGQFDDAELAFKFLNAYLDLLLIPGIETAGQMEQIVRIVESGDCLSGGEKKRAKRIAARLGKLFCRRCGYCQPCPQGVPVTNAMVFDSFLKRFPRERLVGGLADEVAAEGSKCVECGQCQAKCPYNLPIIETIKRSVQNARKLISG